MKLHFANGGTGRPVILLHGLFGSLNNWQSIARRMAESFEVFTVDQRNHGHSPHSSEFSYGAMAQDLLEFLDDRGLASANLLGHSMGGKTAMTFAVRHPERVDRLIVVDISPRFTPRGHDEILKAMSSVDLSLFHTREEIDRALEGPIPDLRLRQFILTNVKRHVGGHYAWKINLAVIRERYEALSASLEGEETFEGPTLFLAGERSPYIGEEDRAVIRDRFPASVVETVAGAGHWVHADAPVEFLRRVTAFLAQ